VRRVGIFLAAYSETDKAGQVRLTTFRKTLGDLGWDDTRNVRLDYRWGAGNAGEVKTLAAELVQSAPDVIVASGDLALAELHRLNRKIPIVFTQVSEPVDSGFVASLARPGGNITGFQNLSRRWAGNGWACSRRSHPM
jgi:putative ABC transport system substrate-binding protein